MKTKTTMTVTIESDDGSLATEPPQPIEGTVELPHTGGLVARWRVWAGEQRNRDEGDSVVVHCAIELPSAQSTLVAPPLRFGARVSVLGQAVYAGWGSEGSDARYRDRYDSFVTYASGMREQRAYCESEIARLVAALDARHAAYVAACAPEPEGDPQDRR